MTIKLPHMPLWVYDIDTSRFCRRLSDADFGRYMRLLLLQWIEGKVPVETEQAMVDAGIEMTAKAETERLLSEKFPVSDDGKCRQNERLANERESAIEKIMRNRENGRKGGRPKKRTDNRTVSQKKPNGSIRASDSDSDSYSGKGDARGKTRRTSQKKTRKPNPLFDTFAELFYPSGVSKSDAGYIGQALSDLEGKSGVTPSAIRYRYEAAREQWNGVTFGPTAISKHWDTLINPDRPPGSWGDDGTGKPITQPIEESLARQLMDMPDEDDE